MPHKGQHHTKEAKEKIGNTQAERYAKNYSGILDKKPCSKCRKVLKAKEFTITRRKLRNGEYRYHLHSICRECDRKKTAKWREGKSPTFLKEQQKKYNRERKRKEVESRKAQGALNIRVAPFKEWLLTYPGDLSQLAHEVGLNRNTLTSIVSRKEKKYVYDTVVDLVLTHVDTDTTLRDLYPDGY